MGLSNTIRTTTAREIATNYAGLEELLNFYTWSQSQSAGRLTWNFSPAFHLDANLSAVVLAIIHKLKREKNVYIFVELGELRNVFFRNGLIGHLKGEGNNNPYPDYRESTIPVTTFDQNDDEAFCVYLRRQFFGHRGLMKVSGGVKEALCMHYEEVFTNVGLHADTSLPVFTCGQYFPEKNQLRFTLVDLGVGFLPKIRAATGNAVTDDRSAILWATEGMNSTKDKQRFGPGGTGLKEIKKYCNENNGTLHICSGKGYVSMVKGRTTEHTLKTPFPGSVISIIMRNI